MARKARKSKARRPVRAVAATAPLAAASAPAASAPAQRPARPVELTLGNRSNAARRPGRITIENSDPGIPIDRVPYLGSDLARLGITVLVMVGLLLAGSRVIPLMVR